MVNPTAYREKNKSENNWSIGISLGKSVSSPSDPAITFVLI